MIDFTKYGVDIGKFVSRVSLEDNTSSEDLVELEYDFYLRIQDFDQLAGADKIIKQEQWSIPFTKESLKSAIRVRQSIENGIFKYEIANKIDIEGYDGVWEIEKEIDRHHFETIKDLAKTGMIKDRFCFPIEGKSMYWEVDVFYDINGKPYEWVKVDLEVEQRLESLPPFPINYVEGILTQKGRRSTEEIDFITKLYKNKFLISKTELKN